jgi:pimeloyl-ACP methyl ester carboxylesterase
MPKKISSRGRVPIAYYEVSGTGAPVVFVHAFPLNHHLWEAQLAAARGRRMLAPDLRGFGDSGPPPGPATMSDLASDVLAAIEEAGIERAHLAGCSMGGYVLMELLRQRPGLALSLALIDTRSGADAEEGRATRLQTAQRLRAGGEEARRQFEEAMIERLLGATTRSKRPAVADKVRAMMARAGTEGLACALEAMAARPDSAADLARFDRPALVVAGAEDALIPAEEARRMAEAMRQAELLIVPEAGHLPPLERPEALAAPLARLWARAE